MSNELDKISELTSRYVGARDNFTARYRLRSSGVIGGQGSGGGPLAFNALIINHAINLAQILPTMSLAQWEGFSELASSYLAQMKLDELQSKGAPQ